MTTQKQLLEAIAELTFWIDKSACKLDKFGTDMVIKCLQKYGSDLIELVENNVVGKNKDLIHTAECLIDTSATTIGRLKRNG